MIRPIKYREPDGAQASGSLHVRAGRHLTGRQTLLMEARCQGADSLMSDALLNARAAIADVRALQTLEQKVPASDSVVMTTSSSTHHEGAQLASAYAQIASDIASILKHAKATREAYDELLKSYDSIMRRPDHKIYAPSADSTTSIEDTQVPTDVQQEKRYYLATFHEMEHSTDVTKHDRWLQQIASYQDIPHALQIVVQDLRTKSALALKSHANTLLAYERQRSRIRQLAAGAHTSKSDSDTKLPCGILVRAQGGKDTEDSLNEVESAKKGRQKMFAATHRDLRLALTALTSISQEEARTDTTVYHIGEARHKLLHDMRAAAELCSSATRFWYADPSPLPWYGRWPPSDVDKAVRKRASMSR